MAEEAFESQTCPFCARHFHNPATLQTHVSSFHILCVSREGETSAVRDLETPSQDSFSPSQASIATEVSKVKRFKCRHCKAEFASRFAYAIHINKSHKLKVKKSWIPCRFCSFKFPSQSILARHINWKHSQGIKLSKTCSVCGLTFKNLKLNIVHCNKKHYEQLSDRWEKCPTCYRLYPSSRYRQLHKCTSVICQFCKRYIKINQFIKHANMSHKNGVEAEWLKCPNCSKYYPSKNSWRLHCIEVHKSVPGHKEKKKTKTQFRGKHLNVIPEQHCITCSIHFESEKEFHIHSYSVHKTVPSRAWLESRNLLSLAQNNSKVDAVEDEISIVFESSPQKNLNYQPKESAVTLSNIVKTTDNSSGSNDHVQTIDNSQGEPKTKKRRKKVKNNKELKTMVTLHFNPTNIEEGERQQAGDNGIGFRQVISKGPRKKVFRCDTCDISFKLKRDCTRHHNVKHLDLIKDKWFLCIFCGIYFPTKMGLDLHHRVHLRSCDPLPLPMTLIQSNHEQSTVATMPTISDVSSNEVSTISSDTVINCPLCSTVHQKGFNLTFHLYEKHGI